MTANGCDHRVLWFVFMVFYTVCKCIESELSYLLISYLDQQILRAKL